MKNRSGSAIPRFLKGQQPYIMRSVWLPAIGFFEESALPLHSLWNN
jgi:hypothetical protein